MKIYSLSTTGDEILCFVKLFIQNPSVVPGAVKSSGLPTCMGGSELYP